MVFIPKAEKRDKTLPKAFRPISLLSIFLKIMEKIIDFHIKTECMKTFPLSKSQYAYQENKSTVTALHTLVTKIENSVEMKEISLAAFLDIHRRSFRQCLLPVNAKRNDKAWFRCDYNQLDRNNAC